VINEDDGRGQWGSVVVLFDEDVPLEEPVLIRVRLDLVESVAETECQLFNKISKQFFYMFLYTTEWFRRCDNKLISPKQ